MIASWLGFVVPRDRVLAALGRRPRATAAGLSLRELRRVVRFGLPNGLNWFLEFAAFQLFVNGVIASLGDETVAALNVVLAVNSISFMPAFGLASAGAILAGQAIGRGEQRRRVAAGQDHARVHARRGCARSASLYLLASHTVLGWFAPARRRRRGWSRIGADDARRSARCGRCSTRTGMTLSETLRAAGDTTWPAAARIMLAWAVFAPCAYVDRPLRRRRRRSARWLCLVGYIALLALAARRALPVAARGEGSS